jgi:hypothetical protein
MGNEVIKSYKGFDKDMKCRDFQYEVGKEYEMDGEISVCNRGFHACESPMEVWDHYDMLDSRFAEVEQSGKLDREAGSTKVCSSKIKIKAELKWADILDLGIEWLKEKTSTSKDTGENDNGEHGAKIGSSGDGAQIGSSGYGAKIGSSGDGAQIGSSGYGAKIGSSGDGAQIGSSGYGAKIDSTGEDSVICCAGDNSKVKAKKGSWITLSDWEYDKIKQRSVPKCVKTEYVDGVRIKADTWYKLIDGEFKEVKP